MDIKNRNLTLPDIPLRIMGLLTVLWIGTGLVIIFSGSYIYAERHTGNPFFYLYRHAAIGGVGFLCAFIISRIKIDYLKKSIPLWLIAAFGLNLLTYVPYIGREAGGASRWINILGFTFQSSEIARVAIILYLGKKLAEREAGESPSLKKDLPALVVTTLLGLLILFQNDFSTTFMFLFTATALYFVSGIKLSAFLGIVSVGSIALTVMVTSKEYRVQRFENYFYTILGGNEKNDQISTSLRAIANGGLLGVGPGQGQVSKRSLPLAQSDFTAAIIGEEFGFIGIFILIFLVSALFVGLISKAQKSRSSFNCYVLIGIGVSLFLQFLINLSVVSGFVPVTGIPLPLFSVGGSNYLMTLILIGICWRILKDEAKI